MTVIQADKAKQFRTLHEAPGAFVIANVWDGDPFIPHDGPNLRE